MIERGSNANGEYVRFADGTQICWKYDADNFTTAASGSLHKEEIPAWTFPAAFASPPVVSFMPHGTACWGGVASPGATVSGARILWSVISVSATTINHSTHAIGRWF
ncbi:hypothetical protein [Leisingera aquaemixtae]|uniref:hypothetical protein n=1 Tax=Leisingera aquaemixtae TaxID=1396826 RepID=UPI00143104F0|nr:hypothetical protein [Leisingera aquaemixtae]